MFDITTIGVAFDARPGNDSDTFPTLRDLCDARGNWANPYLCADELMDWSAVAFDPRSLRYADDDREAMDETNFVAIIEEMSLDAQTIARVARHYDRGTSWRYANLDEATETGAAIHEGVLLLDPAHEEYEDRIDAALRCRRALADYPLLDEEAYCAREMEAWDAYAPDAWGDELRDARRDERYDEATLDALDMIDAREAVDALSPMLHYTEGFGGGYAPAFLDIADALTEEMPPEDWRYSYAVAWRDIRDRAFTAWMNA